MTQEEKQLLLKDLCARLPYGVKALTPWKKDGPGPVTLIDITNSRQVRVFEDWYDIEEIKPYLRPLSSMTEEEEYILHDRVLLDPAYRDDDDACFNDDEIVSYVDYCYSRHLDIHGLIPMGLALEAPKDVYKTE